MKSNEHDWRVASQWKQWHHIHKYVVLHAITYYQLSRKHARWKWISVQNWVYMIANTFQVSSNETGRDNQSHITTGILTDMFFILRVHGSHLHITWRDSQTVRIWVQSIWHNTALSKYLIYSSHILFRTNITRQMIDIIRIRIWWGFILMTNKLYCYHMLELLTELTFFNACKGEEQKNTSIKSIYKIRTTLFIIIFSIFISDFARSSSNIIVGHNSI